MFHGSLNSNNIAPPADIESANHHPGHLSDLVPYPHDRAGSIANKAVPLHLPGWGQEQ
jgi:hypothetical protein